MVREGTLTSQKPGPASKRDRASDKRRTRRPTGYSATTSRPWAVSAQITAMSIAMIAIDHTG